MFLFKRFMVFNRLLKAYFQGFEISVFLTTFLFYTFSLIAFYCLFNNMYIYIDYIYMYTTAATQTITATAAALP